MRLLTALSLSAVLILSGCTTYGETRPQLPVPTNAPAGFASYYEQQVEFESCGRKLMCGEVSVPMDWDNPESDPIKIAIIYRKADSNPRGFVLLNPGGPGSSGYDWVLESSEFLGSATLRKNFNIMGFDPRGVGRSSAVKCLTDLEYDEFLYGVTGYPLGSEEDLAAVREQIADFVAKCQENTGELLGFVDTVSAAKDMDVLRAVVGEQKLNYLGYSYGSFLGTTYANLFPDRVGRLVLDGAIDPTISDEEQTRFQIAAFEKSLRSFLENCEQFRDCPFSGNVEADLKRVELFFQQVEAKPLKTDSGRELTIWAALTGLIMPLYSESYWPLLATAFQEAFIGGGDTFLALADAYNYREDDGTYSNNLIAANYAISCLDARSDSTEAAMLAENERIMEAAPTLGKFWRFGALRCENWPFDIAKRPTDYSAPGTGTIMVIGTTGDPATPYSQAVSLANNILSNGFLVTYNGEGHTIYGHQVSCIDRVVDDFFLTGNVPEKDPNC
jgi:pimeloyl-ACP methyl ester carboxylesterase